MTTSQATNFRREGFFQFDRVKPDAAATINAGDMVFWDTTSKTAKPVTGDASAATFIGVSLDQTPISVYTQTTLDTIRVVGVGVFEFFTTAGDTYNPGDKVYVGADAQTVTNDATGKTNPIGTVAFEPENIGLAGGSGIKVRIDVRRRFPNDVAVS